MAVKVSGVTVIDGSRNIVNIGNIDGRDVSADGTKLDGIETGATADQTPAEIKTAYESNANTNAFTDTEKNKLAGIEVSADVTDTANVTSAGALMRSGGTMTGNLLLNADPTNSLQAATKQYVDTIAAAGLHYHEPVRVESPVNLNATYNNGTAGVGATLTNAGTQGAITVDGVTLSLNDRVLIYVQTNATHNGVYTVTTVGDGSTNWVLTRATDADSYGASDPDAFGQGDAFFVKEGNTGAGELYVMNTEGTITFGTTPITFTQVASTAVYTAGSGIGLTGTQFSVSAGAGLIQENGGLAHSDTSTQTSVNNSGNTFIQDITLDGFGHITGITSSTAVINDATLTLATSGIATGSQTFTANQSSNATFTVNVPATNLTYSTAASTGTVNSSTGTNATIPAATTSTAGLLTSSDKTKLDGIAAGAQVNVATNLGITGTGNTRTITSSTGTNVTVPVATTSTAGFMSTEDKTKLDGIATGATVNQTITAGSGLTGGGSGATVTLSHSDTSSQASVNNSGTTYIQDVTLDTYGHITGLASATLSLGSLGITATATELNYVDGVTSAVQTQLNSKQPTIISSVITSSTTAIKDRHYYLNGAGITLTLPASPNVGDEVHVSEVAGNLNCVIGRNGSNIMSVAENLTIDSAYAVIHLRYVNATIGWAFS